MNKCVTILVAIIAIIVGVNYVYNSTIVTMIRDYFAPECSQQDMRNMCQILVNGYGGVDCQDLENLRKEVFAEYKLNKKCFQKKKESLCTVIEQDLETMGFNCSNIICKHPSNCRQSYTIQASMEKVPPPVVPTLPDEIHIKTTTEVFTNNYMAALRDGKVWYKRNLAFTVGSTTVSVKDEDDDGHWRLLCADGMPHPPSNPDTLEDKVEKVLKKLNRGFVRPNYIRALSSDGENLIMVGDNNIVYYVKWTGFIWQGRWGFDLLPAAVGASPSGWLVINPNEIGNFAISHRGNITKYYTDYFGKHAQTFGVTSFYGLRVDGLGYIPFADPWLPPDWKQGVCAPERGTLRMVGLDAASSSIFVMTESGALYTILADFDSIGNNPNYEVRGYYTYDDTTPIPEQEFNELRLLPGEPWEKQPHIQEQYPDAKLTKTITITQHGEGNNARELRVKAELDGKVGYFYKSIAPPTGKWYFREVPNMAISSEEYLPRVPETTYPAEEMNFASQSAKDLTKSDKLTQVQILHYHKFCTPSTLVLSIGDQKYETIMHSRRMIMKGDKEQWWGTLVFKDSFPPSSPFAKLHQNLFKGHKYFSVLILIQQVACSANTESKDCHVMTIKPRRKFLKLFDIKKRFVWTLKQF